MKRSKQCPKCNSRRIGHIAEQLDIDDSVKGPVGEHPIGLLHRPATRAVGYSPDKHDTGWLAFGKIQPLVGKLEAYVCTDCGYHESYVIEPQAITWTKVVGFSWVNPETPTDGPFR